MFEYIAYSVAILAVAVACLFYLRSQDRETSFNPIQDDDPEMVSARQKARVELPKFRVLLASPHERAVVKVPVTSSRGVVEWMWGDVREIRDTFVSLHFTGRPATHRGKFQPFQTFPINDLADWLVVTGERRFGGYTQRVTFQRLEAEGRMDPVTAAEAAKYE